MFISMGLMVSTSSQQYSDVSFSTAVREDFSHLHLMQNLECNLPQIEQHVFCACEAPDFRLLKTLLISSKDQVVIKMLGGGGRAR